MKTLLKIFLVCLLCLSPTYLLGCKQKPQSQQSDANSDKTEASSKPAVEEILTGSKAWAAGCSAILMERNHEQLDFLATRQINSVNVGKAKELLDTWWGIKSKKDLFESLTWLETGGNRSQFDQTVLIVMPLNEEQFKTFAAKTRDNNNLQKIKIARKYGKALGKKSILGWDYCRYIALCRWGYTSGYISEEEAWAKIMPVARVLQKNFDSWEDLACNFLIGRQFWSYQETRKSGADIEDATQRLLDMPSSPWNKYPWDLNLGNDKDVNDANNKK
jgi:hypothetical protein